MKKILKKSAVGLIIGFINGFFGAGGGLVCVPLLTKSGFEQKKAHANAVAIVMCITVVSAAGYLMKGSVKITEPLIYLPGGLLGAALGTVFLSKINAKWIKKIFGLMMIWAGWRLMAG